MGMETFIVAGRKFEIYFYGRGGHEYAAANVRCDETYRLPAGYQRKLERLEAEEPGTTERMYGWAWDRCVEGWWEWANERAAELDLGIVVACGRSGGQLLVERFSKAYVDGIVDAVNEECNHCGLSYDRHCDGKCLFDCTSFEPKYADGSGDLVNLEGFLRECEASVRGKSAVAALTEEMKFYIDEGWEDRRAESRGKGSRAAG